MNQEEKKQKNKHYISAKESREIVKNNNRTIRELQRKRKSYKREDYVTEMRDPNNIVEFDDLHTYFFTDNGVVKAVNGVSFDIPQGSTVGVVGESGCGKSVTSLSLMQLVQGPMGQIVSGSIRFRSTVRESCVEPLMKPQTDEFGNTVTDENGNPVMVQALDKKGNPKYKKRRIVEVGENVEDAGEISAEELHGNTPNTVESADSVKDTDSEISGADNAVAESSDETLKSDADGEPAEKKTISDLVAAALDKITAKLPKYEQIPVMVQKLVEKPIFDEAGNPVMVQAVNRHGKPKFRKKYDEHEEVVDIAKMPVSDMSSIRGREIAMIFQEPMTSLNPVFTIGYQLDEVTLLHVGGADKDDAKRRSIDMLKLVGIAMPEHVYNSYPHQLSGGMRQRVMIAMALCCNPKLIIADEPTTALDVTIQAQILDLLREVKDKISGSIMLITHDLGVIAEMVDYVVVMYAGRVVEKGTVREIFKNPLHPYTIGLQKSKPVVGKNVDRLYSIPGNVPNPIDMPSTCYFRDRCDMRCEACRGDYPEMIQVSPTHFVACHRYKDLQKEREE